MAAGRALYLRVGVLVLAGAALAVGFVVFLAGQRGLQATELIETYIEESVQGLDVGAPVRYRGVAIGRVTQIGLVSAEYRRPEGVPYEEGFQQVFVRFAVDPALIGDMPSLRDAIRLGLRARIRAQGLTGVNYVEIDYVSPLRYPVPEVAWTPKNPVIPAVPSTVAQVTSAAEVLVQRLTALPVEQIAADLAGVLGNVNRQLAEGDLAVALREASATLALLHRVAEEADLAGTLGEFRAAAAELRGLVGSPAVRAAVADAGAAAAELRRTAQRLPATLQGVDRTLRAARDTTVDVQAELLPILIDLRATTASLRATADQLRNSPSQLLFGAPPAPERRR